MPALDPVVPLRFAIADLPEEAVALRAEVREFLRNELASFDSGPGRDEFGTEEEWASVLGGLMREGMWETVT